MRAKPAWVPDHVPALDGLRGLAIALVLLHHCQPRLRPLGLGAVAEWGWTGVDLFFVLSGFLITGIVLEGRGQRRFFRNFYARRGLRILPVYALVMPLNLWILGRNNTWNGSGPFGVYFALFVFNLMPGLTGTLYPAWSLAIEEQFYLLWAPLARYLPPAGLGVLLAGVLAAEPWLRHHFYGALPTTHTLFHLDGLAVGALLALGLRTLSWSRRGWLRLAGATAGVGLAGSFCAARWAGPWLDTAVALGFGGVLLLALGLDWRGTPRGFPDPAETTPGRCAARPASRSTGLPGRGCHCAGPLGAHGPSPVGVAPRCWPGAWKAPRALPTPAEFRGLFAPALPTVPTARPPRPVADSRGHNAGWVRYGLEARPLRFLGRISYSLYLTHVPVFALIGGLDVALDRAHAGAAGDLAIVAARWGAAIAVASLLWLAYERPILNLKRYFRSGPMPARAAA